MTFNLQFLGGLMAEAVIKKSRKSLREERKKEKLYRKEHNIPSITNYLKDYKGYIFSFILVMLFSMAVNIAITILSAEAITNVTNQLFWLAIRQALIVLTLRVTDFLTTFLLDYIYSKFSKLITTRLNSDLSSQAFKFSATTYANNPSGTFIQRIIYDPQNLIGSLTNVVEVISIAIEQLIICAYIFYLNYIVGLVFVIGMILSLVIERIRVRLNVKYRKISNKKYDKIQSLTTEIVKSERDVKSLNLETSLSKVSSKYYDDHNAFEYKKKTINNSLNQTRSIINNIITYGAMILGIVLLEKSLIVFSTFMIIINNRPSFNMLIFNLSYLFDIKSTIDVYNERIFALFDPRKFPVEDFGSIKLDKVKGKIQFKKVGYAYEDKLRNKNDLNSEHDESSSIKNKKVLDNLSFTIKPNTTVAFVGKSGSGKSTIVSLMSKMYKVDEGEILIDGVNINDLTKETLRNNISLVNQFPYIFDMSIRENLLMAKADATNEELNSAIDRAYLREFVDTLPNGINTVVGESGIKLSGGQRQRLAIARALLRKSSIIIFDESTSSLDNYAQEYVKKSIDDLKGSSTIVIVAHRLTTIKNADVIFFLDEGKIIDKGTFDELFEKNKKFRSMFLAENI